MLEKILYIDDEYYNLQLFKEFFEKEFDIFLAQSAYEGLELMSAYTFKLVIADQRMPDMTGVHFVERAKILYPDTLFIIFSAYAESDTIMQAFNEGLIWKYLVKPWDENLIRINIQNAIETYDLRMSNKQLLFELKHQNEELTRLKDQLKDENFYLREEIMSNSNFEEIVCQNINFQNILKQIEQVANANTSVLIFGETGTGKELIARAIHNISPRFKKTLIKVNCAAIPESLIESELFGHEKGAFTGAIQQKKGKFELADGGTIFLDEIGEMPLDLQPKLLRVLQEGEIERVGGSKPIKINVRVISATNRNLLDEIGKNRFRSDLYYRLNVFPITLPPLRERKDDIPLLVNHFIDKYNKRNSKNITSISQRSVDRLIAYPWPGNIRELENVIERAVVLSKSNKLDIEPFFAPKNEKNDQLELIPLEEIERRYIKKVLDYTSWKVSGENGACEYLKINRTTLLSRMKKLGIARN